jgi:hypothetical protein
MTGYPKLYVSYAYWLYRGDTDGDDALEVHVSPDGGFTWYLLTTHANTTSEWTETILPLTGEVPITDNMQLRFSVEDDGGDTLLEALIDDFQIRAVE